MKLEVSDDRPTITHIRESLWKLTTFTLVSRSPNSPCYSETEPTSHHYVFEGYLGLKYSNFLHYPLGGCSTPSPYILLTSTDWSKSAGPSPMTRCSLSWPISVLPVSMFLITCSGSVVTSVLSVTCLISPMEPSTTTHQHLLPYSDNCCQQH